MLIEQITNAAFVITLDDGRTILTDPWLTPGAYYGSWYQYPPLTEADRKRYLSLRPSWIYISHVHPDHLDPQSLRWFPPDTPVLIGRLPHRHLVRLIEAVGFTDIRQLELGQSTQLGAGVSGTILGPFEGTSQGFIDDVDYALDTSLIIRDADGTLLFNVNDNPIKVSDARAFVDTFGSPDVAILPYSGASIYPHGFTMYSAEEKAVRTRQLTHQMLHRLVDVARVLKPQWTIPAAGSYVLGGRLAEMTTYLHQATPDQIRDTWHRAELPQPGLVLLETGDSLNTKTGSVTQGSLHRTRDYTASDRTEFAMTLRAESLAHERLEIPESFSVPWSRLLTKARQNLWAAQKRANVFPRVDIELRSNANGFPFKFPLDTSEADRVWEAGRPWVAFQIDSRLLLMTLVGAAVWNNLEIGALIQITREPDVYDPTIHSLMSFFQL